MVCKRIIASRWLVKVLITGFLLNALAFAACAQDKGNSVSVKDFGAKGDGVTDDYNALLAAAKYMNQKGKGVLLFPKGIYYIKPFSTKDKEYENIVFSNCDGLTVTGQGAVISVNGDFTRTRDSGSGNGRSNTNAIIPLSFKRCKNLTISGLELNGNVNLMKKEGKIAEGSSHLLTLTECEDVIISNLNIHHSQTDGIYISGRAVPTLNVKMYNVVLANNARQGMSITGLYGGLFTNCKFINTGNTGGSYGRHAPSAGVDIEPRRFKSYKTGKIVFDKCVFADNIGSQFVCTAPATTADVTLKNCDVRSNNKSSEYTMILSAVNLTIDSCTVDCANGSIYGKGKMPGSSVNILNSKISSAESGIRGISPDAGVSLVVKNNQLICTAKNGIGSYFPYLRMPGLVFENNKIFIPSSAVKSKPVSMIQNASVSKNNVFYTDKKEVKPVVAYKGTKYVNDQQ